MLTLNIKAKATLLNLIAVHYGKNSVWNKGNASDCDAIDFIASIATPAIDPPTSLNQGAVWAVIDPLLNTVTAYRVCVSLRTLLTLLNLLSEEERAQMPDRLVWYSLLVSSEQEALIPPFDPLFIPKAHHIALLLDVIMSVNAPGYGRGYYGYGDPGVGKTSTATWLFAVLGYAVITYNCKANMEPEELLLRFLPQQQTLECEANTSDDATVNALNRLTAVTRQGQWSAGYGPLLTAVLHNLPFVVDELDLAPPELLPALNNLIEGRNFSIAGYKDGCVRVGNGFKLIAFGNTGCFGDLDGRYHGRSAFDASFADRLYCDAYTALSKEEYEAILKRNFPDLNADIASCLATFAKMLGDAKTEGKLAQALSPRALCAVIKLYLSYSAYFKYPLMYALAATLGCLCDPECREAVFNVFTLSFAPLQLQVSCDEMYAERYALLPVA